uniref:Golgi SNAP receptor complex member 1 n=1 Tax=Salmo trutta TaxID=8032 RepID=A0A674EGD4_SALTR
LIFNDGLGTVDLRKQARQLENELDLKLVSFSKLCTSYSSSRDGRRGDSNSDTASLLNNSTQDRMFETMSVEIEQLLAKLTGVNDKMAEYTSTPGVTSLNAALMHTLQRHRDILQDYTHEFHKTKANFLAIREREDLLGSVRKDIETYKSGSGVNNRRTELFLKEHEHLRNSGKVVLVYKSVSVILIHGHFWLFVLVDSNLRFKVKGHLGLIGFCMQVNSFRVINKSFTLCIILP